tara:strand:- start:2038 stop:2265 length:228 start_codon:yes stop_codon:yes gene_type:complete
MISEQKVDVYEIKIPSLGLTVKEIAMGAGKRMMLLRPIKVEIRNYGGVLREMTLYETLNFSRGDVGYWSGWILNG